MAATPLLPVRVDAETKARWKAAADERGITLADLVRDSVEAEIAAPPVASPSSWPASRGRKAPKPDGPPLDPSNHGRSPFRRKRDGKRTEMCPHRIPPTSYCSRGCDG